MKHLSVLPTEEDTLFFEENGYWISPKLVNDDHLEQLRERMEWIYDERYETGRTPWQGYWKKSDNKSLRKTDNSHWSDLTIRRLVTDPVIGAIAARLMKTNCIRLWHDQLLYKPGNLKRTTANVGWHQDYSYWQCAAQPTLVTAWVAFDDVDLSNGCMQFIPKSHTWGLVKVNDFFEQDMDSQKRVLRGPNGEKPNPVPVILKAGQVSFHHALTLHGSGPNTTEHPRRSIAIHLMTGDTRYRAGTKGDAHMNVSILNGQDGDVFDHHYFPVLYAE